MTDAELIKIQYNLRYADCMTEEDYFEAFGITGESTARDKILDIFKNVEHVKIAPIEHRQKLSELKFSWINITCENQVLELINDGYYVIK